MTEEAKPERIAVILQLIEKILLRIAEQLDVELIEAENTVAALRKTPRHQCPCPAAETAENKAGSSQGLP